MNFLDALNQMKKGIPMKLPSWGGYWCWDPKKETVVMYTKDNQRLDIRETQRVEYTLQNVLSEDWVPANGENTPVLGGTACRLPRYLTKPRQRRSEWDMAGSDGISRVSAVFRGKSLLTNKMRII